MFALQCDNTVLIVRLCSSGTSSKETDTEAKSSGVKDSEEIKTTKGTTNPRITWAHCVGRIFKNGRVTSLEQERVNLNNAGKLTNIVQFTRKRKEY